MSDRRHCQLVRTNPDGEGWDEATRAHVAECAACAAHLAGVAELGHRLRQLPPRSMPAAMKDRLVAQLAECPTATPAAVPAPRKSLLRLPAVRRVLIPAAMAASLVLGVFLQQNFNFGSGTGSGEVRRNVGMYIHDVTHDHYLLERIGRPLEVAMTDPADLEAWLSQSLAFNVELPETGDQLTLQGGRVWHTVGRLSALASYAAADGARVVLFAVPAANLDLAGASSDMVGDIRVFSGTGWGREARVWIQGDLAMALVAPLGEIPADWDGVFLP